MREEHLEVKRPTRRDAIDRLLDFGHLIAAGVMAAALIAFGVDWSLRPPKDHPDALRVAAQGEAFKQAALTRSFPVDERGAETAATLAALEKSLKHVRTGSTEIPVGLTFPAEWVAIKADGGHNEIRFDAPVDLRASAEAGGVDLRWADPAGNNVRIKAFEIFRSEGGGEGSLVKTVEGSVFTTRDTTAAPGVTYAYRVRSVSGEGTDGSTGAPRSAFSAPASIKAVADFRIELSEAGEAGATFVVEKWDGGVWKRRTYVVKQGEPLGARDDALGVDFTTGRRLSRLALETKTETLTRSEPVFDADGRVVVENGSAKRVERTRAVPYLEATAVVEGGALPPETFVWRGR